MTDTKTTLVWHLKDEVSGPARGIGGALGGLVSPVGLAVGGIALLVGGLGAAAAAAAEEEINVKRLDAALLASVPGWDGNTAAIEATIEARESLAFSDDSLRASLAALVTSTGDVTEAENLQIIAMDLARLKGVDLETATIAVAKASQGSTRELKAMGLEINESATASENLATIAAAAAGQAEGYASTTTGKWEVLQTKFGNVVESVGTALLPILTGLADFAIDTLIPALEDFAEIVGPILQTAFAVLGPIIGGFIDNFVKPAIRFVTDLIGFVQDAIQFLQDLGLVASALPASTGGARRPGAVPRRQHGGPVEAGETYLVGEAGPEYLTLGGSAGMVIPGSAPVAGVPVQIPILIDGREVARLVDEHLYYRLQTTIPTLPAR